MFPNLYDRIYHQIDLKTKKILATSRRKKLKSTNFSIISNNCWGGVCYEHYGLLKQSPTIGMYFYPEDYIKLISNIQHYLSCDMLVVTSDKSNQQKLLKRDNANKYFVGKIDDIEAVLVHYKDPIIAVEKWKRRCQRVNLDNLIFKFCQQNGCTEGQLKKFDTMELPGKKFMFIKNNRLDFKCGVYYRGFENSVQIENDTFYWDKYFDVTAFINGEGLHRKD